MNHKTKEDTSKKNKKQLYEICSAIEFLPIERIESALASHSNDIEEYAYIIHDRDKYTAEDESKNPRHKDGELKMTHSHVMIKLVESRRRADVASWFGVTENYVQDSKHGRFDSMLMYLVHENAPDKYQYDVSKVKANFDYTQRVQEFRDKVAKRDKAKRKEELINLTATGVLKPFNYTQFLTASEWNMYHKDIKNTWEYRESAVRSTRRNMEVIYIYGDGRCGKSTLADQICTRKGYTYEHSGSSKDRMKPYNGHDAYILDELRGNSFPFDDLMGILDNFINRDVPARYRDKSLSECKLLIITTTQKIEEFFAELAVDRPKEPPQQLYGRCGTMIEMDRWHINYYEYDDRKQEYTEALTTPNTVFAGIPLRIRSADIEERKKNAANLLGVEVADIKEISVGTL